MRKAVNAHFDFVQLLDGHGYVMPGGQLVLEPRVHAELSRYEFGLCMVGELAVAVIVSALPAGTSPTYPQASEVVAIESIQPVIGNRVAIGATTTRSVPGAAAAAAAAVVVYNFGLILHDPESLVVVATMDGVVFQVRMLFDHDAEAWSATVSPTD